jgi:microsomal epoxide hydrolase
MASYETIPAAAALRPQKYHLEIPDQDVSDFKELLRLSRLAPKTYENLQSDGKYGVTHEWMSKAKEYWLTKYDWYVCCSESTKCWLRSMV